MSFRPSSCSLRIAACLGALALLCAMAGSAAAASLSRPSAAWAERVTVGGAVLAWSPVPGATRYELRRGTEVVASVASTGVILRGLAPSSYYQYTVVATDGARRSVASDPIPVTTLAPTACTRYVSSTGSDDGDGSADAPWRTVRRLVDAWEPGTVGCLDGGFVEDVTIRQGGTADAPVVLRARPGVNAAIRGRLWISSGADHVVVAGLRLDGRANTGAARATLPSPTVNGDAAMLIGNDISNARTHVCVVLGSIRGYGTTSDTVLAYNRIHDCGRRSGTAGRITNNNHHGVYVESSERLRIVDNVIYDNADRGIQLYPNAQRSLIQGNLIERNGEGVIFSGAEGYSSGGNVVLANVIANSRIRSNIEHYWERPSRPGRGNVAARNCLGGAHDGNMSLPALGWVPRGNTTGVLVYRNRPGRDFTPLAGSGCRALLRTGALPLVPR
ncbi:MAG: hypothetical protein JWM98_1701 [Thermoleophilia bacterium]|nr:hypothetical protein [Thermoleophilia bacterium]